MGYVGDALYCWQPSPRATFIRSVSNEVWDAVCLVKSGLRIPDDGTGEFYFMSAIQRRRHPAKITELTASRGLLEKAEWSERHATTMLIEA